MVELFRVRAHVERQLIAIVLRKTRQRKLKEFVQLIGKPIIAEGESS
jgi:hypothetical protein